MWRWSKGDWAGQSLLQKGLPKVEVIEGRMSKRWGTGTVVIPAPVEVDEFMRKIPKGRLITTRELQAALAKKHNATMACPITTGIFAWIAAHAAEEEATVGKKRITPYWRTLKSGGEINPKYPGGAGVIAERPKAEGHAIVAKEARCFVADYEKRLGRL
jgi:hypothetical protein